MHRRFLSTACILILFLASVGVVDACKGVMVVGSASSDDANYLLKVRDPSRLGYQVLTLVPGGTVYDFWTPWTGDVLSMCFQRKVIGVATVGDTLPNIVKCGMCLSDAGVAYGDSDTNSGWVNPSSWAWDDFDWMRYASQDAVSVDQAVVRLGVEAVNEMHAPGVSENMFVVDSQKGAVVEGDVCHCAVEWVYDGILARQNYPVELWDTQYRYLVPYARSYDRVNERWMSHGGVLRLDSLFGVRVMMVDDFSVQVSLFPSFLMNVWNLSDPVSLSVGACTKLGRYVVELDDIVDGKALVRLSTEAYAWDSLVEEKLNEMHGEIGIEELIAVARWNSSSLLGLRGMCEEESFYSASTVMRLPSEYPEVLSSGWFAANHACSSVYVPFHICDSEIEEHFASGEAAMVASSLFEMYGDSLLPTLESAEAAFRSDVFGCEVMAYLFLGWGWDVTELVTGVDVSLQRQGFLLMESLLDAEGNETIVDLIHSAWESEDISDSLSTVAGSVENEDVAQSLRELAQLREEMSDLLDFSVDQ